ncbi:MAG: indole-3-glycerol phosphate synthase TrpC [Saprospiraceae bacterium]|nr:indole-3-glycerol phosphate synthase TrpC [Saprospiraceae bacterium]
MNILDKIVAAKRIEVGERKEMTPLSILAQRPYFKEPCYSIKRALKASGSTGIIAEHKRKSPSLGWIRQDSDAAEVAQGYALAGASAMSVLTDEEFFGGTLSDLQRARRTVSIPLLRKDFIIEEYQIYEAKAYGADLILLIAECLRKEEVKHLAETARNLGLEVLMEMHDEEGLDKICDAVTCVGINSRNLKTFEVSLDNAIRLAQQIPDSFVKVAESGISKPETIELLRGHGFEGFLIGEAFMKTDDPTQAIADFISKIQRHA